MTVTCAHITFICFIYTYICLFKCIIFETYTYFTLLIHIKPSYFSNYLRIAYYASYYASNHSWLELSD